MAANTTPKVSVVMGVYNGAKFLREAVESVLGQTFGDFEFLITDDGSTDQSADILRQFSDPRIKVHTNAQNEGLTRCLIRGLSQARGKYIARMDADDISYPTRFQKQAEFLEAHPDHAVVGTRCHYLDSEGKARAISGHLCTSDELGRDVWRRCPIAHGSAMFSRKYIMACGGYRELFRYAQDYDLWLRVMERYRAANLPDPLYGLRYHLESITLRSIYLQSQFVELARDFARMRAEVGSDPIMQGDVEKTRARIESWGPDGALQSMRIRSDSALRLLGFMVPFGRFSGISALWLTALCNNPLNAGVWKFLFSDPFKSRLKKAIRNRLRPGVSV